MEIPAQVFFNQTVVDAIKSQSTTAKNTKSFKRMKIRYITPDQEIERINAHDLFRGNDQEEARRTANGKYPTYEIGENSEVIHISYVTLDEERLTALEFGTENKETKRKDKVYIIDKPTILAVMQLFDSSTSDTEFKERLANRYVAYSTKDKKFIEINKAEIVSMDLRSGVEVRKILEEANILMTSNDRTPKV